MIQKQSGITNNKNFLRHRFSCYYDYKISRFDIIIIIINHTMKFLSMLIYVRDCDVDLFHVSIDSIDSFDSLKIR